MQFNSTTAYADGRAKIMSGCNRVACAQRNRVACAQRNRLRGQAEGGSTGIDEYVSRAIDRICSGEMYEQSALI